MRNLPPRLLSGPHSPRTERKTPTPVPGGAQDGGQTSVSAFGAATSFLKEVQTGKRWDARTRGVHVGDGVPYAPPRPRPGSVFVMYPNFL
jgi:hypothetical protein